MNLFTIDHRSEALGKNAALTVLLPAGAAFGAPIRTLYLLHGMTDDHSSWLRKSQIELYAERHGLMVVMPNADLSFYADMRYGADYLCYITEELPAFLARYFPVSGGRDAAVAGVSMGGYGAFLAAMRRPELYGAAVSLSGPMRISSIYNVLTDSRLADAYARCDQQDGAARDGVSADYARSGGLPLQLVRGLADLSTHRWGRLFRAMFGENAGLDGGNYDLFSLAGDVAGQSAPPRFLAYCGDADLHWHGNLDFERHALDLGLPYSLTRGSGGHSWFYWNTVVGDMIEQLYGERTKSRP